MKKATIFDKLYETKIGDKDLGYYSNLFPIIFMYLILSICCLIILYFMIFPNC